MNSISASEADATKVSVETDYTMDDKVRVVQVSAATTNSVCAPRIASEAMLSAAERWVQITSGSLSASSSQSTLLWSGNPHYSLTNTTMYKNKMDGFRYYRADLELKLSVSANAYQAGRLVLFTMPYCDAGQVEWNIRTYSIVQACQMRHVELDYACGSEAVLTIPFQSNAEGWNIGDSQLNV